MERRLNHGYEGTHGAYYVLYVRKLEPVLCKQVKPVVHELVVVWLVSRSAAEFRYSSRLRERNPDFGYKDSFKV